MIKRYRFTWDVASNDESATIGMEEHDKGGFVRFEEIERLRAQLETLQTAHTQLIVAYAEVREATIEECAKACEAAVAGTTVELVGIGFAVEIRALKPKAANGEIHE